MHRRVVLRTAGCEATDRSDGFPIVRAMPELLALLRGPFNLAHVADRGIEPCQSMSIGLDRGDLAARRVGVPGVGTPRATRFSERRRLEPAGASVCCVESAPPRLDSSPAVRTVPAHPMGPNTQRGGSQPREPERAQRRIEPERAHWSHPEPKTLCPPHSDGLRPRRRSRPWSDSVSKSIPIRSRVQALVILQGRANACSPPC